MRRIAPYLGFLVTLLPAPLAAETPPVIYPPALRPGDTVAVVAPAGTLERARVERARGRLQKMGLKLRIPPNLYRRRGYLAGDDTQRAEELMAAWRNPNVKAIFVGAGGYGVTRMLDQLDFSVIKANPKILLGYSDITALHLAVQRKTGLVTFHGPLLCYGLGSPENLTAFSAEWLWRALLARSYVDWSGEAIEPGYELHIPPEAGTLHVLASGRAQGRLTGGNLSLVCTLMGTPYEIQTDGRILFLEDVNEEPYRIDRYLSQLRLAGKFDRVAGVILGVWHGCGSSKGEDSLSLDQVLHDYFADLGVPVVVDFPAGHTRQNATLPLNAMVEIDAGQRLVRVLENPVELETGSAVTPEPNDPTEPEPMTQPSDQPEEPGVEPPPDSRPAPDLQRAEPDSVELARPKQPTPAPQKPVPPDVLRRIP